MEGEIKKGFTLIEMVVVMALIAVLFSIGAFAFISARNQYLLDGEAEKLLSTIREAQNKAIAVNKDKTGKDTKVWSLGIYPGSNKYVLESFYPSTTPGELIVLEERSVDISGSITISAINSHTADVDPHVSFASPFATTYLTSGSLTGSGACTWKTAVERPAKDYFIDSACTNVMASKKVQGDNILIITLSDGKQTETIKVNTNGDSYIE